MDVRPGDEVLIRVEVVAIFRDPDWGTWLRVRSTDPWGSISYRPASPSQIVRLAHGLPAALSAPP
jgi:hypothetical protein